MVREKHEKDLTICIDYHDTYATDPKLWNSIIQLFYLRKNNVVCISRDHNGGEDEILDSIGKVIGKDGRIANAIRTVVKAAAARKDRKVTVEIMARKQVA